MNIVHSILRTPKRRMTTALGVAKCQALLSVCISYQSLRDAIDKWPVNRFGPCFPCRQVIGKLQFCCRKFGDRIPASWIIFKNRKKSASDNCIVVSPIWIAS